MCYSALHACFRHWVFITGECSRRGVQWTGVALYNKSSIRHHINHYTLFPLHPPLMNPDRYIIRIYNKNIDNNNHENNDNNDNNNDNSDSSSNNNNNTYN